jgi:hypothetical protein
MSTIIDKEGTNLKKISAIILVVMLVAGWSRWGAKEEAIPPSSEIEVLESALSAARAQPLRGELHAWAEINGDGSLLELESAVAVIVKEFGLNRQEYDINSRSNGQYAYAHMEGDLADGVLKVTATSVAMETTVEVSIFQNRAEGLGLHVSRLKTAFTLLGEEGKNVKITTCLEGTLNARLKDSDKLNFVYVVFNSINAIYRGAVEAKGISLWSGWSPLISDAVDAGGKQVNFCLSLRWDADVCKNIIRVATPVMPSSY